MPDVVNYTTWQAGTVTSDFSSGASWTGNVLPQPGTIGLFNGTLVESVISSTGQISLNGTTLDITNTTGVGFNVGNFLINGSSSVLVEAGAQAVIHTSTSFVNNGIVAVTGSATLSILGASVTGAGALQVGTGGEIDFGGTGVVGTVTMLDATGTVGILAGSFGHDTVQGLQAGDTVVLLDPGGAHGYVGSAYEQNGTLTFYSGTTAVASILTPGVANGAGIDYNAGLARGTIVTWDSQLTKEPPNLVYNNSFEDDGTNFTTLHTPISFWTTSGGRIGEGLNTADSKLAGPNYLAIGTSGSLGTVSQVITTVIGQTYLFGFSYSSDGTSGNVFKALWNGTVETSVTGTAFDTGWGNYISNLYTVTATGTQTTISFQGQSGNGSSFIGVDNVGVLALPSARVMNWIGGSADWETLAGWNDSTTPANPATSLPDVADSVFLNGGTYTNSVAAGEVEAIATLQVDGTAPTLSVAGSVSLFGGAGSSDIVVGGTASGSILVAGSQALLGGGVSGAMFIGSGATGVGHVTVGAGGTIQVNGSSTQSALGMGQRGQGSLSVSGAGATMLAVGSANIGFAGTATVSIDHGGSMAVTGGLNIGTGGTPGGSQAEGGLGVVTVGTLGTLSVTGPGVVGGFGSTGSLDIQAGGTAGFAGQLTVGSSGTINSGTFSGTGIVDVESGATLNIGNSNSNNVLVLGGFAGATALPGAVGTMVVNGVVNLNGATQTANPAVQIGGVGTGALTVSGPGAVLNGGTFEEIGVGVASTGTGTLTVSNGGTVYAGSPNVGAIQALVVGRSGTGTVVIDGANSLLRAAGPVQVGLGGAGTLVLENGATLDAGTAASGMNIGRGASGNTTNIGGSGTGTIETGATLISHSGLNVGGYGVNGSLGLTGAYATIAAGVNIGLGNIIAGATVGGSGTMSIGAGGTIIAQAGSAGIAALLVGSGGGDGTVSLTGGSLDLTGEIVLGINGGSGALAVYGGVVTQHTIAGEAAAINVGEGGFGVRTGGTIQLADQALVGAAGGTATLVAGLGLITGTSMAFGGFAGNSDTLLMESGGSLQLTASLGFSTGATLNATGGNITASNMVMGTGADGTLNGTTLDFFGLGLQVDTGASLGGNGSIAANVNDFGILFASGGLLDISGDLLGAGSVAIGASAILEIGGASGSQMYTFQGTGSTLKLDAPSSFAGTLDSFGPGSILDLAGTAASNPVQAGDSLVVTLGGGGTLAFTLSGPLSNERFGAITDGAGGTDIVAFGYAQPGTITPNPVSLGNVHVGSSAGLALTVSNTAPTTGYYENLDAAPAGTSSGIVASGTVSALAAGGTSTSGLSVGVSTASEGVQSGSATIALSTDGSGIVADGNGPLAIGTQIIAVSGTVYGLATPAVTPNPLDLGAARIGDASPGGVVSVSNGGADSFREALVYSLGTLPGPFFSGGPTSGTVAAGGAAGAINLGLNTAVSGDFSGATTSVALTSTGAGSSGLADTALPSQTLTLNGKVYAAATAALSTSSVDFGIVHVGDVAATTLAVSNTATGALTDMLVGGFGSISLPFTGTGTIGAVAAGATGTLSLGLSTTAAGQFAGAANLALSSHDGDLSDISVAAGPVSVAGTVLNYATAALEELSAVGDWSQNGNAYTLDLGSIARGGGTITADLAALNSAISLSDVLGGGFAIVPSSAFSNSGFGAFSGLGAGQSDTQPVVTLNSGVSGIFNETITLSATGSNATGYSGPVQTRTLTVTGTVTGGNTYTLTTGPDTVVGSPFNDTFLASQTTLSNGDRIDGAGGTNTLVLQGGGKFDLRAPTVLANIQVVDAREGRPLASGDPNQKQGVYLRAGTAMTVNVAPDPWTGSSSEVPGITIYGADNSDTVNFGPGNDYILVGGPHETIHAQGRGTFEVNGTTIGATIDGGGGLSHLIVDGGGTVAMGSSLTNIGWVSLSDAATPWNFIADAQTGLKIVGSTGADTVTLQAASQIYQSNGGHDTVMLTATTAGATVMGDANTTLDVTGGGTAALNAGDTVGMVKVDANTILWGSRMAFATTLDGSAGNDRLHALGAHQTLIGGAGDALFGASANDTMFEGTAAQMKGDWIQFFAGSDVIDLTNVTYASGMTPTYTPNAQGGDLTVGGVTMHMIGAYSLANFQLGADASTTGTAITFKP